MIVGNKSASAIKILESDIKPLHEDIVFQLALLFHSTKKNLDNNIHAVVGKNMQSIYIITSIAGFSFFFGLFITRYVTRRIINAEENVVLQKERAEQANNAKSLFLATMSHEIRSPLSAIIGFSQRLRKYGIDKNNSQYLVTSINRNSQHLFQLINDIMDLTKIEAGQLDLEKVLISPFRLISEIESTITANAQDKGLRFKVNYIYPLPAKIMTEPTRFKQILLNLCSNAIKFTDKGSVSINVSCNNRNKLLLIDVIDTGIGLSEDKQKVIFDSFTQADASTTRKYGGSGLGLNISRKLARQLGGDILLNSSEGRGSKFSITTTIDGISEASFVYEYRYDNVDWVDDSKQQYTKLFGNVLLAEDTIDNQRLIELFVCDTGAQITIVNNGSEAVKICETHQFDVILMDMQMPVLDGIQATQKIRTAGVKTPIVMLTASAMKSDYERCIDVGANDFLTKPIDVERFNQTLYKFLPHTQPHHNSVSYTDKFKQLISEFLQDLPRHIKNIKKLRDEQCWADLEKQTHILKGRGTTFGYPQITKFSGEISHHCHIHDHKKASTEVDELERYCQSIYAHK